MTFLCHAKKTAEEHSLSKRHEETAEVGRKHTGADESDSYETHAPFFGWANGAHVQAARCQCVRRARCDVLILQANVLWQEVMLIECHYSAQHQLTV